MNLGLGFREGCAVSDNILVGIAQRRIVLPLLVRLFSVFISSSTVGIRKLS